MEEILLAEIPVLTSARLFGVFVVGDMIVWLVVHVEVQLVRCSAVGAWNVR